ncbi:hypothetical protein [Desulfobotulus sp.]|jgi:hypothetical protein|uniref:hypothetical protein n=1 Tax=Desulfobotulus sp. TaxID=1940337 RepID=UPI002A36401B|nr:hypothetical protein [Desulfobotulus sp.]MDY0163711.1 hypothetical protein [Desulfobotulus sp.]
MLNTKVEYKKVLMDGLNAMRHNESIRHYQERGWTLFGVTPNTQEMKMEYRFKRPK